MVSSVQINTVEKRYGQTVTLRGATLDVQPGEFMTLVGPSGCGKSTLLRILAGLVPQDGGEVRIDGRVVDHLPPRARDVAMVFQSYALYPHMTVAENIASPVRMQRLSRLDRMPLLGPLVPGRRARMRGIADEVAQVARQVEIEALLSRKPAQLSGGQRQRVALARAIIRNPKVFLMDEPLSNLDARLRVAMRAEITALHRRLGATFIYVTHDQTEAMTMSSRVAVMMDGEIVQCAAPQDLYDNPQDVRVARFIGSPEINLVPSDDIAAWGPAGAALVQGVAPMQIAFRPEAVRLGLTAGTGAEMAGHVSASCRMLRCERLGHNVLVFLQPQTGAATLVARLDAAEFAALPGDGEGLCARIPLDRLIAFDAAGHRVAMRAGQAQTQARGLVTHDR